MSILHPSTYISPEIMSSFGETLVAQSTPILQVTASYGLVNELATIESETGTSTAINGLFTVNSGTHPAGLGSINTNKQLSYKAGQGALCRISSLFSIGVASSLQAAGLINSEDGFAFGYLNEDFGIITLQQGITEYQELTVTTPASAPQTAIITINDIPYSVPLTAGTVEHNAIEIAESLTLQVINYLSTANVATVGIMSKIPSVQGVYSFSSDGDAVASFVQVSIGTEPLLDLIKQENWNRNNTPWLIPQNLNNYSISIKDAGNIHFYVEHTITGTPLLVHTIYFTNTSTLPIVGNPTFRIGWLSRNLGNTIPLTVAGASAAGLIEGVEVKDALPRGRTSSIASVGLTQTNLITLRNRFHFGGRVNRIPIIPLLLSLGTDSTKGALFTLTANASFTTDAVFHYEDKATSTTEYTTDPVVISGGRVLATFYVSDSGLVITSDQFKTIVFPDDQLTLSSAVTATPASFVVGSVVFLEDL